MFSASRERIKSSRLIRFLSSIRFRLTALFVVILSATVVFFSLLVYQVFTRNHIREFDAALYNYTVDVANSIHVNFFGDLRFRPYVPFDEKKAFPFSLGQAFFQITDLSGGPIARSGNLGDATLLIQPEEVARLLREDVIFDSIPASAMPPGADPSARYYRVIKYLVKLPNATSTILIVAVPMTLFEKETKGLVQFLWIFVPMLIVVATTGGWLFAGSALRPIKAIYAKARGMGASDLSQRLPVPNSDDEIHHLSLTLNDFLAKIERAFTSQEKFIADVSHEMKTPLAILRGEIDLLRQRVGEGEVREFLDSAEQEVRQLGQVVENLLLLARVDAGVSGLDRTKIRMDEVIVETVARIEPLARARAIRISMNLKESLNPGERAPFEINGDNGLLVCLGKNLVENAIKFSHVGDVVQVDLEDDAAEVRLRVTDHGPGIPEVEKKRIFERFYRAESVRVETRGSGLGLHLVERIVEIHGGRIQLESESGKGTAFQVTLPKSV